MEIVLNLKKKMEQTEYETIFHYAKNALGKKKALNPNFDYNCLYISYIFIYFIY